MEGLFFMAFSEALFIFNNTCFSALLKKGERDLLSIKDFFRVSACLRNSILIDKSLKRST